MRGGACAVDVLVVGLGPAGASAAGAAARAGLTVLAIERRERIGFPVQCAEFVPLPLVGHARGDGVLMQRIAAMRTVLPSGTSVRTGFPGLMVDRAAFDRALAAEAAASGAVLRTGTHLRGLDPAASRATIETDGERQAVSYRLLVAADGPHSGIARALGLPPLRTVLTRQYRVPLREAGDSTDVWLSPEYPGGYAWLFPRGETANLGLGMDPAFGGDLKRSLDRLHAGLVTDGRVDGAVLARTGGAIPVGGLRRNLAAGNVLFTGDAAGFTHPITGAGIAAAVVSGTRAGEAAHAWIVLRRTDALAEFEDDMREQFEGALDRACARRIELERAARRGGDGGDPVQRRGWIAFPEYFAA